MAYGLNKFRCLRLVDNDEDASNVTPSTLPHVHLVCTRMPRTVAAARSSLQPNAANRTHMERPKIPRRPLGATGLQVSVLGFGGSGLGGVFAPVDEDVCRQTVHAAFEAGINLFDTSPYYGITKAETMLGKAIQGLPRSELVIATKVGRYGADEFNFSADRVTASVTESLNRLQTNYIDIIQCHDIEFGDLEVVVNETLPALQKLKAQGLVRHIGITGLPFKVFHYVLDRVSAGTVDVVLSYCHNTLNDSTLLLELPYFESKGVGVINASPLAMGLLTNSGPPDWHPAPQRLLDAARDAAQRASARGADLPKLAVCEAVKTPGIASTLVGMLSPDVVATNVESALQALGVIPNPSAGLESDALSDVRDALSDVQGLTWPSGRVENN